VTAHFGDRLAAAVERRSSQLVLGLDPDPSRLWPQALASVPEAGSPVERIAAAVAAHCLAVIDAAGPACVAVKPQLACFERLGAPGWAALELTARHAQGAGLLVLADGKRGDVPVSAAAYAHALVGSTPTPLGEVPGLGADAFTANPLLGRDALEPLLAAAGERGAGIFVLVRTSNPGAADVEDLELAGGRPLWERLAELVAELGAGRVGEGGLSDVGAVTGATEPRHLERMRALMPHAVFLLPGIGAQGGRAEDAAPAFGGRRAAALVTASRSISDAALEAGSAAAALPVAERLRETAWAISG
jgi:orotidine-5'-phosphate decarboxylase